MSDASAIMIVVASMLVILALAAGIDLLLLGNPDALAAVVAASASAIFCVAVAWILRRLDR